MPTEGRMTTALEAARAGGLLREAAIAARNSNFSYKERIEKMLDLLREALPIAEDLHEVQAARRIRKPRRPAVLQRDTAESRKKAAAAKLAKNQEAALAREEARQKRVEGHANRRLAAEAEHRRARVEPGAAGQRALDRVRDERGAPLRPRGREGTGDGRLRHVR